MALLLLVSLLWAFSPGLIKHHLGDLSAPAVASIRLALTFLVFAPFLRRKLAETSTLLWLAGIGAVQFGAMYLLYLQAYKHLQGHEVFLFTILTPIYIVLLDGALDNKLRLRHAIAAVLSAIGAGIVIKRGAGTADVMIGFLLVQGSNFCFAAGQVAFKRTRPALQRMNDAQAFAWLALGGAAATIAIAAPLADWSTFKPSFTQWGILTFLGVISSGAGFFLWNRGLMKVNAGTLATINNLKIPLGVAVSLLVFREAADLPRLIASLVVLAFALWLASSGKEPK